MYVKGKLISISLRLVKGLINQKESNIQALLLLVSLDKLMNLMGLFLKKRTLLAQIFIQRLFFTVLPFQATTRSFLSRMNMIRSKISLANQNQKMMKLLQSLMSNTQSIKHLKTRKWLKKKVFKSKNHYRGDQKSVIFSKISTIFSL